MTSIENKACILRDILIIQLKYYKHFKKFANIRNPITFNEKIQYLKLYDRKEEYTQIVDKLSVKDHISQKIGADYIIPTLCVWNNADEIQFDTLPMQFVLKWNHDSGSVIICKDKTFFDKEEAVKYLTKAKKHNGYLYGREWPYKNVKPRLFAEEYLTDDGDELTDYKIHCFQGKPEFILVCKDRFSVNGMTEDFYDIHWNHLPVKRPNHNCSQRLIDKPEQLSEMIDIAKILSEGYKFLRVDFYNVNGKIFIGELTLYPASGFSPFYPEKYDTIFGKMLDVR